MIPYMWDSKTLPWHRTADIPITFGHLHPIPVNLDTGSTSSAVTRQTASEIGITNYPQAEPPTVCGSPGSRVPIRIGPITIEMNLYIDPHGRYDVISAQELLLSGYTVTFRNGGVDIF
jgi:hypothetical protein